MRLLIFLIAAICSGCASTTVCPALKTYDKDWQKELALELQTLPEPEYPRLFEGVADYITLRQQVKACQ